MKWSVHSEKGKFTREVAGKLCKHKVIFKFIENYPKISKYRSLSALWNLRENGKMLFDTLLLPVLYLLLKNTFAVLPFAFSMLNSPHQPRNSQFVTITQQPIWPPDFILFIVLPDFLYLRYFKALFPFKGPIALLVMKYFIVRYHYRLLTTVSS